MLIANYCPQSDMMPLLGGRFCGTKRMVGFLLLAAGTTIEDTFAKTDYDALVASGSVIGFIRPDGLEDNNEDPGFSTSNTGVRNQTSEGRKGWRFMFYKSSCFQNELNKLNQSEAWDFAPVLEDGSIVLRRTKSGAYAGFGAKMFVGIYNLPIMGGDETGSVLEVDLVSSLAYWQNDGHVLTSDEFDFNEINPVAGLNIEVPALVAAATTTTVTITNLCSDAYVVGLTDVANWMMERNGVLEAVSGTIAYDANNKTYTFTHAALVTGNKIAFLTMKNGDPIYVKDTNYYTGKSDVVTVV